MSGYTEGPWSVRLRTAHTPACVYDSQGWMVANCNRSGIEEDANAKLIAAAPKMVEALLIIKGMAKNNAPCSARQIEAIADIALRAAGVEV